MMARARSRPDARTGRVDLYGRNICAVVPEWLEVEDNDRSMPRFLGASELDF